MRLAVLKERRASETRVAATPDTVKRLIALGLAVAVEAGAGAEAAIPDREFVAAGATISPDAADALSGSEIVFAVQMPLPEQRALIQRGALLVCTASASPARRPWTCCRVRQIWRAIVLSLKLPAHSSAAFR